MTTLDDLLRAILADPADDGARLAYADRLEEEGQTERAEFLRVQCELAQREADGRDRSECSWGGTCCCRSHELGRRERELLVEHYSEWLGHVGRLLPVWHKDHGYCWAAPGGGHVTPDSRCGFVHAITCSCADWLAHGPAVVAAQPVTAVRLSDKRPVKSKGREAYTWSCAKARVLPEFHDLPPDLFDQLLPDPKCVRVRDGFILSARDYDFEADAVAGVGRACVRWARAAAGLPPLAG
jgi:uncharacterized protein (TIGR02996 family)